MKNAKLKTCLPSYWIAALGVLLLASLGQAQTYADLYDLTQATGSGPGTPDVLVQGEDGNLYGTMPSSFPGEGTAVVAPPSGGIVTVTHYFEGVDGNGPESGLTLGMDGNLYGTTYIHSGTAYGEVFQLTPAGAVTVLYSFANGSEDRRAHV